MAPKAVLIGLPGSGKSTIGRRLAKALNLTMLDTDAAIEETTGRTIADIFATDGEAEFRRIEEEVIRSALATRSYPPQNPLPFPDRAITWTAGSRSARSTHCASSTGRSSVIPLPRSGRLSVMRATRPSTA